MSEPTQRMIETNGIRLNIAEQGEGPPVLLCHGFPESWYSWRHQIDALPAGYGFRSDVTFYTAHGDVFAWICVLLSLVIMAWSGRKLLRQAVAASPAKS